MRDNGTGQDSGEAMTASRERNVLGRLETNAAAFVYCDDGSNETFQTGKDKKPKKEDSGIGFHTEISHHSHAIVLRAPTKYCSIPVNNDCGG